MFTVYTTTYSLVMNEWIRFKSSTTHSVSYHCYQVTGYTILKIYFIIANDSVQYFEQIGIKFRT